MQCRVFHEHFQIFYLFIHFIFLLFNLDLNQFTEIGGSKELISNFHFMEWPNRKIKWKSKSLQ